MQDITHWFYEAGREDGPTMGESPLLWVRGWVLRGLVLGWLTFCSLGPVAVLVLVLRNH